MSMIHLLIGITAIIGTVITYYAALKIHHKYHYPFTLPMLIATIIIVLILLIIPISYETYMIGGEWINKLLGPAVVALAYPLYMERKLLKKMVVPILVGTCIGALVGISTGVLLAKWAGFGEEILLTISSKSVTTPISMAITESLDRISHFQLSSSDPNISMHSLPQRPRHVSVASLVVFALRRRWFRRRTACGVRNGRATTPTRCRKPRTATPTTMPSTN